MDPGDVVSTTDFVPGPVKIDRKERNATRAVRPLIAHSSPTTPSLSQPFKLKGIDGVFTLAGIARSGVQPPFRRLADERGDRLPGSSLASVRADRARVALVIAKEPLKIVHAERLVAGRHELIDSLEAADRATRRGRRRGDIAEILGEVVVRVQQLTTIGAQD